MAGNESVELVEMLAARAESLEVRTDVALVLDDPRIGSDQTGPRLWWLAVAAVVAMVGLVMVVSGGEDLATEPAQTSQEGVGGDAAPVISEEVIVWLHGDASPEAVDLVASSLEESRVVEAVVFMDREATYREFVEHFADEPEVIESVDPEQLPLSFLVTTSAPAEVAKILDTMPAVEAVERANS